MPVAVGQRIPDFALPATDGRKLTPAELLDGYRAAVITFFPLAFTGG